MILPRPRPLACLLALLGASLVCTNAYYSVMEQIWKSEIGLIRNNKLRGAGESSLRTTRARYGELIASMKRAEGKLPPVLTAFRNQVLYLEHNLNARAIAALESTLGELEGDVASLIPDMDTSVQEADRFLLTLEEEA